MRSRKITTKRAGAYAKLANLKSDSAEIQFNAGLLEQKADNAKEAIEYYSKAIEIDPEFAEAYLNLGVGPYCYRRGSRSG